MLGHPLDQVQVDQTLVKRPPRKDLVESQLRHDCADWRVDLLEKQIRIDDTDNRFGLAKRLLKARALGWLYLSCKGGKQDFYRRVSVNFEGPPGLSTTASRGLSMTAWPLFTLA